MLGLIGTPVLFDVSAFFCLAALECKYKYCNCKNLLFFDEKSEISEIISSKLDDVGLAEQDDWIESLIESLQRQSLSSNVLDLKSVRAALKDLQGDFKNRTFKKKDGPHSTVVFS